MYNIKKRIEIQVVILVFFVNAEFIWHFHKGPKDKLLANRDIQTAEIHLSPWNYYVFRCYSVVKDRMKTYYFVSEGRALIMGWY